MKKWKNKMKIDKTHLQNLPKAKKIYKHGSVYHKNNVFHYTTFYFLKCNILNVIFLSAIKI